MRAELSARHANYNTHMLKSAAYELMKWLSRIDGISYRPRTFITGCRNIQTRALQDAKLFAKSTGVWVKRTRKQITQTPVNVSTKEIWFLLEKSGNKTNLTRDFFYYYFYSGLNYTFFGCPGRQRYAVRHGQILPWKCCAHQLMFYRSFGA